MAPVPWDAIAPFVQDAYHYKGRVERADCLDLALAANAPDDAVDALDALGSRIFPDPQAVREFLTRQGWVAP